MKSIFRKWATLPTFNIQIRRLSNETSRSRLIELEKNISDIENDVKINSLLFRGK